MNKYSNARLISITRSVQASISSPEKSAFAFEMWLPIDLFMPAIISAAIPDFHARPTEVRKAGTKYFVSVGIIRTRAVFNPEKPNTRATSRSSGLIESNPSIRFCQIMGVTIRAEIITGSFSVSLIPMIDQRISITEATGVAFITVMPIDVKVRANGKSLQMHAQIIPVTTPITRPIKIRKIDDSTVFQNLVVTTSLKSVLTVLIGPGKIISLGSMRDENNSQSKSHMRMDNIIIRALISGNIRFLFNGIYLNSVFCKYIRENRSSSRSGDAVINGFSYEIRYGFDGHAFLNNNV